MENELRRRASNMKREQTPKGTFISKTGPGDFQIGDRVAVKRGQFTLDARYAGKTGKVLGWSSPHQYIMVEDANGEEFAFHPESLIKSN